MPFERPSLQEIVDRIISDFQTRIEGAATFTRRSVLRVMGRVYAGTVHLLYGFLEFIKDQIFVTTADRENLEVHGLEYGIPRKAAAKATGSATGSGNIDGITIPANTRFTSSSNQIYISDADATISGGSATLDLTAEEAGDDGNETGGTTLTFVSPIASVDTTITIAVAGLDGGLDEEEDDAYRQRVLTRKRQPPHGGAEFDYETWALEVSGVTRAWPFPQIYGIGTIGLAFVRDNDDPILPSESERDDVRDYIVEHTDPLTGIQVGIPVTAEPGFVVLPLTFLTVNITIGIFPNTAEVQGQVQTALEDMFFVEGGPGESIYLSQISEAISSATSEERHRIVSPTTTVTATAFQIHQLGTITYEDF